MLITTLMPPKWIRYAGELLVAVARMHASHGQILRTDRCTPQSATLVKTGKYLGDRGVSLHGLANHDEQL
jgi:hypothetical protein